MAGILGWKDILRPIRDGYRHLFPTPDTGPTPEERCRRRVQDRLKGFIYFDTFEQLESWTVNDSDPLQRANTPLLPRHSDLNVTNETQANVLLCHDYAGNYHDYESVQKLSQDDEMYTCEYLQFVDTFVYFSHKLVCVPPPTWTNTLHRNGVKALGTILLEPQTKETERLLQHTGDGDNMKFGLATQLAEIAKHYGFDGFLVNIEKPFPMDRWSPVVLRSFLVQLRNEMGDQMQLVWYDALTTSNEVSYQNSLNVSNLPFAEACGYILTNYCWSESQARTSKHFAAQSGYPSENVYFGIDVWAQNNTGITHPRTTFPKRGGGGTNTGIAVAKLAELGLSAGVFAPAWSFEHFPGRGKEIEQVMWEGKTLPSDIDCPCGNTASRHQPTPALAITEHARDFPAGSESFFYTNFTRAFANQSEGIGNVSDGHTIAQLSAQSILPLHSPSADRSRLTHRLENTTQQSKLIIEAHNVPPAVTRWLPLYKLNMPADGSLRITITCRNLQVIVGTLGVYVKFSNHNDPQLFPLDDDYKGICTIEGRIGKSSHLDSRAEELGLHLDGFNGSKTIETILEVYSISIVPIGHNQLHDKQSIDNIRIEHRGEGDNSHMRLCWNYTAGAKARTHGGPYSELTGPFSHFFVKIDGMQVGRAYALEYIVDGDLAETLTNKEIEVEIVGIGFDGGGLACQTTTLRIGYRERY
jgi:hypothetical protein